jgi:hypothetical protein
VSQACVRHYCERTQAGLVFREAMEIRWWVISWTKSWENEIQISRKTEDEVMKVNPVSH